jgi:hypothetical protein
MSVFKFLVYRNLSINGNYKNILIQTAHVYVVKLNTFDISLSYSSTIYAIFNNKSLYLTSVQAMG